ncbi:hypothetical protein MMC07_007980 [Pseudocyphellaria aurata]|nr:hypothetical protein [Pseudocyphellaria aurata]
MSTSTSPRPQTPEHVVEKVLRRVEVAKMARKLQDRLALASYKAQHGLDNLSFNLVEAHLDNTIRQKRASSSVGTSSDSSSSVSGHQLFSSTLGSSPITAPFFSHQIQNSEGNQGYRKRRLHQPAFSQTVSSSSPRKRARAQSTAHPVFESSRTSWKKAHNLSESSPVYPEQHDHYSRSRHANLSFVSDVPTIPDSPPFGNASDDDSQRLPRHSFNAQLSKFNSSPPRTPPPTRSRSLRHRKGNATGEEGADLLLYLATSPSPAHPGAKARVYPPSTPPSNTAALPSSMMSTPGGGGFMAGFNTPGQQFNFADFVNITPSPAQGAFGSRTPGPPRTPLAAKEARRRLNFDSLVPPGGSPIIGTVGRGSVGKEAGLGMELGGELVS